MSKNSPEYLYLNHLKSMIKIKNGQVIMASLPLGIIFTFFFAKDIFEYLSPRPAVMGLFTIFTVIVSVIFAGIFVALLFIISMKTHDDKKIMLNIEKRCK